MFEVLFDPTASSSLVPATFGLGVLPIASPQSVRRPGAGCHRDPLSGELVDDVPAADRAEASAWAWRAEEEAADREAEMALLAMERRIEAELEHYSELARLGYERPLNGYE